MEKRRLNGAVRIRRASRSDAARSDRTWKRAPDEFWGVRFHDRSDRGSRPALQAGPSNRRPFPF